MTQQIGSGSAKGLIEFLEFLVNKGQATHGAIRPIKTACLRIFSTVDGEEWEKVDVREMDVDDYIKRFKNLTIGNYKEGSLEVYASRLRKSVEWYKKFLVQPGWSPEFGKKSTTPLDGGKKKVTQKPDVDKSASRHVALDVGAKDEQHVTTPKLDNSGRSLIAYPFPLASGEMATLYLPPSLSKKDAARISGFLVTLVIEEDHDESVGL